MKVFYDTEADMGVLQGRTAGRGSGLPQAALAVCAALLFAAGNAARANPYQPNTQAWADWNAIAAHETDRMIRERDEAAAAQRRAQQEAHMRESGGGDCYGAFDTPAHFWSEAQSTCMKKMRRQPGNGRAPDTLHDSAGVLAVHWVDSNTVEGGDSGVVNGAQVRGSADEAFGLYLHGRNGGCRAPGRQKSPESCIPVMAFRNMCGAVAIGRLKNGQGDRFYPAYFAPSELAQPVNAHIHEESRSGVHSREAVGARAVELCRGDAEVDAASCRVPEHDTFHLCADPVLSY